jgi:hypothetical protein
MGVGFKGKVELGQKSDIAGIGLLKKEVLE